MRKRILPSLLLSLLVPTAAALAQESQMTPRNAFNQMAYGHLKNLILGSAEKMPEADFNFKPTESVRSFGQVLGHVADSNYYFCSLARGEKNPELKIEKTKTTKAELISALKDAFAYCDKGYSGLTEAAADEKVKFMSHDMPKINVLSVNNMHTIEHYGNLVTYLRLKNIVPPSTEMQAKAETKK